MPPDGAFHIDILARLGDAFRFEDLEAGRLPFESITVSVATPRTLYQMKRDTVRLKDRAVVYQFDWRREPCFGPGFAGVGALASIRPTIHFASCRVSVTPAAIAGDVRSVL